MDTAQKSLSGRLREDRGFADMLNACGNGLILVDAQGRIELVNQVVLNLFEYDEANLVGQPIEVLVPDNVRPDHHRLREGYASAPESRPMGLGRDLLARAQSGRLFPVEIGLNVLRDNGEVKVLATVFDISRRKQAEDALRQAVLDYQRSNAELKQFAYAASHDLQEPLRSVSGFTELLAMEYAGQLSTEADEYLQFIQQAAHRMSDLINGLLAYSRIETHGQEARVLNCDQVVRGVLGNLHALIEESDAQVHLDTLPEVRADEVQLIQLFQNLIGNALKYRHPERVPELHIRARRDGAHWQFSVQDNGLGIDPRYHETIFVIFQRLHPQNDIPGTGIGLSICRKIVDRHGGRIWLESVPGEGSTFFFTLPDPPSHARTRVT